MRVRSRIILPGILVVTLIVGAGVAIGGYTRYELMLTRENEALQMASVLLEEELTRYEEMVQSLAYQVAENPDVQELFANRDREGLLALVGDSYERLNREYGVDKFHFHIPPAVSFLRVHAPTSYGDDLSTFRHSVVFVNRTGQGVVGIEKGIYGLSVRGVVPIWYEGRLIGSVEFGVPLNTAFVEAIASNSGVDVSVHTFGRTVEDEATGGQWVMLASSTGRRLARGQELSAAMESGEPQTMNVWRWNIPYTVMLLPLRDFSGEVVAVAELSRPQIEMMEGVKRLVLIGIGIGAAIILAFWAVTALSLQPVLRSMRSIVTAAQRFSQGDLDARAPVGLHDEIGEVASAFNSMADQLQGLVAALEQRVTARTRELETVGDIGRVAGATRDLGTLLERTTTMLRNRLNLLCAQVFLTDTMGDHLVLWESTSEHGRKLIEAKYRLDVDQSSLIGSVAAQNEAVLATDLKSLVPRPEWLDPEAASELVVPLRVGHRVIGVLDVQRAEPRAFSVEDQPLYQNLADQIAIAVDNVRLYRSVQESLNEVERLNRQLTAQSWAGYLETRGVAGIGVTADAHTVRPDSSWSSLLRQAAVSGELVIDRSGPTPVIAIPLVTRGAVIGALEFVSETEIVDDEMLNMVRDMADRLAAALDNARLFEQAQRLADRERLLSELSAELQRALQVDQVLSTAAGELRSMFRARRVSVRLGSDGGAETVREGDHDG